MCVVYYLQASDEAAQFEQEHRHLLRLHPSLCGALVLVRMVTMNGSNDNGGGDSNTRGHIAEVG
jgi:hypothetical protein